MRWALLLAGCLGPPLVVAGHPMYAERWIQDEKEVRQRAHFELSCGELEVIPLVTYTESGHEWAKQIGVSGCGHRLVYLKDWTTGWVLNSSDGSPK